jgi:hypothetical protein
MPQTARPPGLASSICTALNNKMVNKECFGKGSWSKFSWPNLMSLSYLHKGTEENHESHFECLVSALSRFPSLSSLISSDRSVMNFTAISHE